MNLENKINQLMEGLEHQSNVDVIDLQSVKKAFSILDEFDLSDGEKCFKYFASLNLINAYVKKEYAEPNIKQHYSFKRYIIKALSYLSVNSVIGVQVGKSDDNVVYLCIYGLQFSFHSVLSKESTMNLQDMKWLGIRLQPYAKYIFDYAINLK